LKTRPAQERLLPSEWKNRSNGGVRFMALASAVTAISA